MPNVIREDVVKLDFEIEGLKELQKLQNEINDLKKKLTGGIGDDSFDDLKRGANETVKPLKKVKEQAEKVTKSLTTMGKKAATTAFNGLKKIAGISFKALSIGITAVATALGGMIAKSVSAFADFQQLKGGVETLFGAQGAKSVEEYAKLTGKSVNQVKDKYKSLLEAQDIVFKNANDAYKTAGLSANDYMTTVTGFSASLVSSLGGDTVKAAKLADQALVDMSDNANKMGTPMENIQNAYQAFAKQNYTLLDNLKLGYGGTKTEMERLLKDAQKLTGQKYDISSYADIIKAIHAIQENMGITDTTAKEASTTITGSLSSMRAAWGNLLTAMSSGENLDQCINNMVDSVEIFADNVMPVIEKALGGLGSVIEKIAPIIAEKLPSLAEKLLPPLIKAAVELTKGLIKALPPIIKTLAVTIVDIFGEQFPIIEKIGNFIKDNAGKIAKGLKIIIPTVIALSAAFKGFKAIKSVASFFGGLKGGAGDAGEKGGLLSGITNTFKSLAKTKPTVILQGMANLAIILGGMTLLTAALMKIAPFMAQLTDVKSFVKVVAAIGVLGLVGTGLAKLGEIAGKIPVVTVVKGLANMAIMIAGMSALFLLVGALSLIKFDLNRILKISLIIGVLGTIGAALALFGGIVGIIPVYVVALGLANMAIMIAGMSALLLLLGAVAKLNIDLKRILQIVAVITVIGALGTALALFGGIAGIIPFPIVLQGLTNIGLVLGGMTGLIVAFGKLTEVKGFTTFLEKGGQVLVQIMNILGEMVGALAGGVVEGLSSCLPALGENLGKFGENIKPLFTSIAGVDMGGVGAFFTSLVGLLGIATGNEIVEKIKSFFGGKDESALAKLGTDLCDFATNSKGFFDTVAGMNPTGFTNAKLMFESLADISNVPNTGGIAQWFSGTNDFAALATGLKDLSSDDVIGFYNKIATLPEAGFNNAKALFESLADIGNIPNTGGVAQWFSGENDFAGLAEKLPPFGEAMTQFYNSIAGIEDFSRISNLFKALKGIGKAFPNKGGLAQLFTGENDITGVGESLKQFGEDTKSFFTQVNSLNIEKLNGLWNSLKKSKGITADNLKKVKSNISDIVKEVSKLPNKMGEGLKNAGESLSTAIVDVWKEAVKASVKPVNKLLSGANHILKEFGSKKRVIEWQPYARGTDGHKGGNALVNDGRGAELIQMPNGRMFIPNGRNVFLPNAPRGMKVLPAEQTARLMGRNSPSFRYADGIGNIDIWSYYDNAKGLVNKISEGISYEGMSSFASNVGKGMVSTFKGEMSAWVDKLFEENGQSIGSYVASKGVSQWLPTVVRALKMEGQYSAANVARTLFQMQTESGGNPRAINLWDSNAKKGIPSKGLMQVIDPTFKAYARKGFDKNIYDPLSNILASVRYATSRYGTLSKAYRGVGYSKGVGTVTMPERSINLTYTPESDSGYYTTNSVEHNTYAPRFEVNISGTSDDRTMYRKIKRMIAEAWNEMFDDLETKTPQTQQV